MAKIKHTYEHLIFKLKLTFGMLVSMQPRIIQIIKFGGTNTEILRYNFDLILFISIIIIYPIRVEWGGLQDPAHGNPLLTQLGSKLNTYIF